MKLNSLLSIISLGLFISVNAQQLKPCATDEMYAKRVAENPRIAEIADEVRANITDGARNLEQFDRAGGTLTIPIVFHIIHNNGQENISKAQVEDAVRVLNEDFRLQNADAVEIDPLFTSRAADVQVEFKLARLDPQGNCTDGIVRVESDLTYTAGDDVKPLSRWPNTKYLNVWVVNDIEDDDPNDNGIILGYAYLPNVVFWGPNIDGIVIRADRMGTIGTSNGEGRTLTHEVGHYLGLSHTFDGGCNGGDDVSDTPPVAQANNGCNLSLNTCSNDNPDIKDNIQNHMDYTSCRRMFTNGQSSRMNSAISQYRSGLVSNSNLQATGVDGPPQTCTPVAEFVASDIEVCQGASVTFTDFSWNGEPTSWDWTFPGGTPASSNDPNPTITYNTPGVYSVTLSVTNSAGTDTETKVGHVTVGGEADFSNWIYQEGFEDEGAFNTNWTTVSDGGSTWLHYDNAGYTGTSCVRMNSYGTNDGSIDELISPSYDFSQVSNASLFTFKLAHTLRNSESADKLRLFFSVDCGRTWLLRWVKVGASMATAPDQTSPFTPSSQSEWEEFSVSVPSNIWSASNVKFKFEFTAGGGNLLYIDDINMSGPVGVDEIEASDLAMNVFPNPSTDVSTLNFNLPMDMEVSIYATDLMGRKIELQQNSKLLSGNHQVDISKSQLGSAGIYNITVESASFRAIEKLVVY